MTTKLVKLPAPAYWSRWYVTRDGERCGMVERRGGFSPWSAYTRHGDLISHSLRTRADAVDAVVRTREPK
jgi:hypothetical protein